jgi:hypothetical protein
VVDVVSSRFLSTTYSSVQNLGFLTQTRDSDSTSPDTEVFADGPEVNGTGPFDDDEIPDVDPTLRFSGVLNPLVLNAIEPLKYLIGTEVIYEEDPDTFFPTRGEDVTLQNGETDLVWIGVGRLPETARVGEVRTIAYGGFEFDVGGSRILKKDIAYVGVQDVAPGPGGWIQGKTAKLGTGALLVRLGAAKDDFRFLKADRAGVDVRTTTEGDASNNEVQEVTVNGAVGGTFTLSFYGNTTAALAYNVSAADMQAALEGPLGILDVTVFRNISDTDNDGFDEISYTITFMTPEKTNVAQLTANGL